MRQVEQKSESVGCSNSGEVLNAGAFAGLKIGFDGVDGGSAIRPRSSR